MPLLGLKRESNALEQDLQVSNKERQIDPNGKNAMDAEGRNVHAKPA